MKCGSTSEPRRGQTFATRQDARWVVPANVAAIRSRRTVVETVSPIPAPVSCCGVSISPKFGERPRLPRTKQYGLAVCSWRGMRPFHGDIPLLVAVGSRHTTHSSILEVILSP